VAGLGVRQVVIGYDFRYGAKRAGDPESLQRAGLDAGFGVTIVAQVGAAGEVFSSSAIRAELAQGDVAGAAQMMGHWWRVAGRVVAGAGRGTGLGYPTANLKLARDVALGHGIYAVRIHPDGKAYRAAAYLGTRPTFDDGEPVLELFLFDFDGDLYGREIAVEFIDFVRADAKFTSIEALKAQMAEDCSRAQALLDQAPAEPTPPGAGDGDPGRGAKCGAGTDGSPPPLAIKRRRWRCDVFGCLPGADFALGYGLRNTGHCAAVGSPFASRRRLVLGPGIRWRAAAAWTGMGSMTANGSTNNKWIGKRTIRPDGVDKVTGRAAFGADFSQPGMLFGRVLRSPHPHARIKSINFDKALALPGVKAVMSGHDLVDFPWDKPVILGIQDLRFISRNVMARDRAFYAGHAVAAVAATSVAIAAAAVKLIEVDYEVLPWVIDVDEAVEAGAPILHEDMRGVGAKPGVATTSNIAGKLEHKLGDCEQGFAAAEVIVERSFKTKPVHQGYIEPHACVVSVAKDGRTTIWSSSQGHFMVRDMTGQLTGTKLSDIRAIP